jgi:hypothetical protein
MSGTNQLDFLEKESRRLLPPAKDDVESQLRFLSNEANRLDSESKPPSNNAADLAFNLQAKNLNATKTTLPNSSIRQEFVQTVLPAFPTQAALRQRLKQGGTRPGCDDLLLSFLGCAVSNSLVSRASKINPESMLINTVQRNPNANMNQQQQVTMQLSTAKKVIEESLVPMNSAHKRKFSSTIKALYSEYDSFCLSFF